MIEGLLEEISISLRIDANEQPYHHILTVVHGEHTIKRQFAKRSDAEGAVDILEGVLHLPPYTLRSIIDYKQQ